MVDIERIGDGQGFPVLKDVAPVALVGYNGLSLLVLHTYRKEIPRARRVAVPSSESERQVFVIMPQFIAIDFQLFTFNFFRRISQVIATAHRIEEDVGKMAGIVGFIACLLDAVVEGNDTAEGIGRSPDSGFNLRDGI